MTTEEQLEKLRAFAQAVFDDWPEPPFVTDRWDLQELGHKYGLLSIERVEKPCGEVCICGEAGMFPTECYRRTELLKGTK